MARYRITVRGEGCELRGTLQAGSHRLSEFAQAMEPFGMVIVSEVPLDDGNLEDWNAEKQARLEQVGTNQAYRDSQLPCPVCKGKTDHAAACSVPVLGLGAAPVLTGLADLDSTLESLRAFQASLREDRP